jgi:hypothetical protein
MVRLKVPEAVKRAADQLVRAQRAQRAKERAEQAHGKAAERLERERLRPAAKRILEWAKALVATGIVDGVDELEVAYRAGQRGGTIVCVNRRGAVVVDISAGYGGAHIVSSKQDELLRLCPGEIEWIGDWIDADRPWHHIEKCAAKGEKSTSG